MENFRIYSRRNVREQMAKIFPLFEEDHLFIACFFVSFEVRFVHAAGKKMKVMNTYYTFMKRKMDC